MGIDYLLKARLGTVLKKLDNPLMLNYKLEQLNMDTEIILYLKLLRYLGIIQPHTESMFMAIFVKLK